MPTPEGVTYPRHVKDKTNTLKRKADKLIYDMKNLSIKEHNTQCALNVVKKELDSIIARQKYVKSELCGMWERAILDYLKKLQYHTFYGDTGIYKFHTSMSTKDIINIYVRRYLPDGSYVVPVNWHFAVNTLTKETLSRVRQNVRDYLARNVLKNPAKSSAVATILPRKPSNVGKTAVLKRNIIGAQGNIIAEKGTTWLIREESYTYTRTEDKDITSAHYYLVSSDGNRHLTSVCDTCVKVL